MSATALLDYLEELGVRLWVTKDGGVRYSGSRSAVTPEVISAIRYFKPEIVELLDDDPAHRLGLVAKWSRDFGFISLHDPTTGEWHDVQTKEAPAWARREAGKRRELHKGGNRNAYRLTSREMEEIFEAETSTTEEEAGIVEEHPIEEEKLA